MTPCRQGGLGVCLDHERPEGRARDVCGAALYVGVDGLCDVGREAAVRSAPLPDDLARLTVGMRIRGPMTGLTAVQSLVGDAMAVIDDDRHPNRVPEARRILTAAFGLCVRLRSRYGGRRRRRA